MAWARGALARIVVDLLYEIGGGPGGPGVTLDQLTDRVTRRPPPGIRYAAIRQYANEGGSRGWFGASFGTTLFRDDGALGIDILTDPTGRPWFTERQAIYRLLYSALRNGRARRWVIREGDRWRIASADAGPLVNGLGRYNASARAKLDTIDRRHAKSVNVDAALERIDDPVLAELVLRNYWGDRPKGMYHRRRADYNRMVEAMRKLDDPGKLRTVVMELAGRTLGP